MNQKHMMAIERQRIFKVCEVFCEIMSGPNPLTREEIAKLVAKRPRYAVLAKYTEEK